MFGWISKIVNKKLYYEKDRQVEKISEEISHLPVLGYINSK